MTCINVKKYTLFLCLMLLITGIGWYIFIHRYTRQHPVYVAHEEPESFDSQDKLSCFDHLAEKKEHLIIDSPGELAGYRDLRYPRCKEISDVGIDFDKKTLLGKFVATEGCSADFKKMVLRNDEEKQYIYSIDVLKKGECDTRFASMNWILIPRRFIYYGVTFEVNERLVSD